MYLFRNNATSTLRQDTPAASTTLTLPSGEGARFPAPVAPDLATVTIEDRRTGQLEICTLTARVADVLTVVRAQEGTVALDFYAGATVSNRMTAGTLAALQASGTFFYGGPYDVPPIPGPAPGEVGEAGQVMPNPIPPGTQYFNLQNSTIYVWDGTAWVTYTVFVPLDGHLAMIGNLQMADNQIVFAPGAAGDTIVDGGGGEIVNVMLDGEGSVFLMRRQMTPGGAWDTLAEGQLELNVPDLQIATAPVGGGTGTPLIAVRFFATTAAYAVGDYVINAGALLRAQTANGPGAFNSADWVAGSGGLPEAPIDGESYVRKDGGWVTLDAVQIVTDAPADGNEYVRKDLSWTLHDKSWTGITGKPATFPPSAHTHAVSDVSGLQSQLDSKADLTALNQEISDRTADVDAEESARIAAINSEATTRGNADTTLQNNINQEISDRTADVNAEESARIAADNALDAAKVDRTSTTGAAVLPAGTSGQRPGTPAAGYVRYNSTTGKFEGFSTSWGTLGGGAGIADAPPSNPSHGDLWWESDTGNMYIYYTDANSSQWVQTNYVPAGVFSMITAPVNPPANTFWWDSDSGNLYIYYNDGSSSQWVQVNYAPDPVALRNDAQKYARLCAQRNIVYNGDFLINQINANTVVTTTGAYFCDGWQFGFAGGAGSAQLVSGFAASSLARTGNRGQIKCTTAKGSLAAGDIFQVYKSIEGVDIRTLKWGTIGAVPAIVRFGFKGPAGTYGVSISNAPGADTSWVGLFTIAAGEANTDKLIVLAVPPATTGTWSLGNAQAASLRINLACGTTFQAPATGWQSGNYCTTSAQFNGLSSTSNVFEVFDLSFVPDVDNLGSTGVDPGFSALDYTQEFQRCQRYYQTVAISVGQYVGVAAVAINAQVQLPTQLRTGPTISLSSAGTLSNVTSVTAGGDATRATFSVTITSPGAGYVTDRLYIYDARM